MKSESDEGMPARDAYELIRLGLRVDGQTSMNLASFVTTWMEPEAQVLIHDAISTNHIDHEEYPVAERVEEICVRMLADLWHAPDHSNAVGVAITITPPARAMSHSPRRSA